jgi:hypothetical protein
LASCMVRQKAFNLKTKTEIWLVLPKQTSMWGSSLYVLWLPPMCTQHIKSIAFFRTSLRKFVVEWSLTIEFTHHHPPPRSPLCHATRALGVNVIP